MNRRTTLTEVRDTTTQLSTSSSEAIRRALVWMPARLMSGCLMGYGVAQSRLLASVPFVERWLMESATSSLVPGTADATLALAIVIAVVSSGGMPWGAGRSGRWAERTLRRATWALPVAVGALAGHGIALWSSPLDGQAVGYVALLLVTSMAVVTCISIVTAGLCGAIAGTSARNATNA